MRTIKFLVLLTFICLHNYVYAEDPFNILTPESNFTVTNLDDSADIIITRSTNVNVNKGGLFDKHPINTLLYDNNVEPPATFITLENKQETIVASVVYVDPTLLAHKIKYSSYNTKSNVAPALNLEELLIWGGLGAIVGVIAFKENRIVGGVLGFAGGAVAGVISTRASQSY